MKKPWPPGRLAQHKARLIELGAVQNTRNRFYWQLPKVLGKYAFVTLWDNLGLFEVGIIDPNRHIFRQSKKLKKKVLQAMYLRKPQTEQLYDDETLDLINRLGEEHVIENPDITNGLWFAKPGSLYIIPKDEGMELIGPDDEISDRINQLCQEGVDEFKLAEILEAEFDLLPVANVLKRWEPTMGYYYA